MFVTFEGPEGSGKSTSIKLVAEELVELGYQVRTTKEPGAGKVGEKIREILLGGTSVHPRAELFLFLADRAQHVESELRPWLDEGKLVLCDRYVDSTVVYQGHARGLDIELMRKWNQFATCDLIPDITILLDIDPKMGLSRQSKRDRLDSEPLEFHQAVREGFLSESKLNPKRWKVINASQPLSEVVTQATAAILELEKFGKNKYAKR